MALDTGGLKMQHSKKIRKKKQGLFQKSQSAQTEDNPRHKSIKEINLILKHLSS